MGVLKLNNYGVWEEIPLGGPDLFTEPVKILNLKTPEGFAKHTYQLEGLPLRLKMPDGSWETVAYLRETSWDWRNTAEGGASGDYVTSANSGGASGRAWDMVDKVYFDNEQQYERALSYRHFGSYYTEMMWWSPGGATYDATASFYLKLSGYPEFATTGHASICGMGVMDPYLPTSDPLGFDDVFLEQSGVLSFVDRDNYLVPMTTPVPLDQWVKVEYRIQTADGGESTSTAKLFLDPSSSTADEEISASTNTRVYWGGVDDYITDYINQCSFGWANYYSHPVSYIPALWYDDIRFTASNVFSAAQMY